MSAPTPRTDRAWNVHGDIAEAAWSLARKLERELAEQQWLKECAVKRAKELAEDLAHERETSRLRLLAMHEREDGFTETRKRLSALETALAAERAKVRTLRSALQNLCDEQNGAPLERRCGEWQEAMDEACAALAATEETKP